ncbi:hypothetical protein KUTeg_004683 [Tegillarca granosa]|uniref:Uncharacterized protein n=1 Tax=Tegillarca granosa TaxID=220873 RepID=A0ABQ9FND9_TEGGR|nr:hypothetical protein KUTeg_004683 [Tegillarca granosa]
MHIALQPNTKGVLSMLSFPSNLSSDDRNIMHYLRQYIKESDKEKLKLFLRFCTGADLLLPISLSFGYFKHYHGLSNVIMVGSFN